MPFAYDFERGVGKGVVNIRLHPMGCLTVTEVTETGAKFEVWAGTKRHTVVFGEPVNLSYVLVSGNATSYKLMFWENDAEGWCPVIGNVKPVEVVEPGAKAK